VLLEFIALGESPGRRLAESESTARRLPSPAAVPTIAKSPHSRLRRGEEIPQSEPVATITRLLVGHGAEITDAGSHVHGAA